jgi:hypothetical protein
VAAAAAAAGLCALSEAARDASGDEEEDSRGEQAEH